MSESLSEADAGDTVTIHENEQLGEEEGADDISMDDPVRNSFRKKKTTTKFPIFKF